MLKIKEYVKAESLEQAYELNQKKSNVILGGMLWLKMQNRNITTAIDLSGLELNHIEEKPEEYRIGAMVTLRQLEQHPGLNHLTQGALRESVRQIVGVQFRNLATIGGSIFGRYGFSDVLTLFLAMNAEVELFHRGTVTMQEFVSLKPDNDILVAIHVKKQEMKTAYLSQRNTKTDFPVLTCAVCQIKDMTRCAIGARPNKAVCFEDERHILSTMSEENIYRFAESISGKVTTGTNLRAGSEYRRVLVEVLTRRALQKIAEQGGAQDEDNPVAEW